ncbi:procathepsin L [Hydra vulgaris]|uniref:procathepsin L n=1 Tax=Hydra vulgaris TaxID=6087 RepID=UPI001F5ECBDC|nr:procathepsin L [Hydra vulgaris]
MKHLILIAILLQSYSFELHSFLDDPQTPMKNPEWRRFKIKFGKFYSNQDEETSKYLNWKKNNENIINHNSENHSFEIGINQFSDLTHEEFMEIHGGCLKLSKSIVNFTKEFSLPNKVNIPDKVDWRTEGYVTPVKNQGLCRSCWAFSTTGALEGQTFRKTGILPTLSEQNLVDCSKSYGNQGCDGGWTNNAFEYIKDNDGLDSENGYPYDAKELGYCYYDEKYKEASDSGFVEIPYGDEDALKEAVATVGPIAVNIDASKPSFQSYKSGVYNEPTCGNGITNLTHAVLVVGYGTEKGHKFWLVKNSWGKTWGDHGYIKMSRNKSNQCGIATRASFPLV